jgi:hypothetical protein
VAVEPLAKALRATKGSCYWHLADRNALLQATLELWDRRDARPGAGRLRRDAGRRHEATKLRNLVEFALLSVQRGANEGAGSIELALQSV